MFRPILVSDVNNNNEYIQAHSELGPGINNKYNYVPLIMFRPILVSDINNNNVYVQTHSELGPGINNNVKYNYSNVVIIFIYVMIDKNIVASLVQTYNIWCHYLIQKVLLIAIPFHLAANSHILSTNVQHMVPLLDPESTIDCHTLSPSGKGNKGVTHWCMQ